MVGFLNTLRAKSPADLKQYIKAAMGHGGKARELVVQRALKRFPGRNSSVTSGTPFDELVGHDTEIIKPRERLLLKPRTILIACPHLPRRVKLSERPR
jgi:hypothetical protein